MDTRAIGIFDSGVGGLTVLLEIAKALYNEELIYLGDTKNFPYGDKSKENIIKIAKKCVKFFIDKNVKLIVIACGTATTQAIEELRETFNIPIIGIVTPTIEAIKKQTINGEKIGIIATEGTIRSKKWEKELKYNIPNIEIINQACPLLAPMAEQGWIVNNVAKETIKEYMKPFINQNISKLILGCTHYPLFKEIIREELGNDVDIINTGEKMANYLKEYLKEKGLENNMNKRGECSYFLTDIECNFIKVASNILQEPDIKEKIRKINIE
ncbi:MAG: glutamate racemase [Clostridia bacterium]|jgi:glutamate racemase|nr:glutamate racemase [Clostridia bacterium]